MNLYQTAGKFIRNITVLSDSSKLELVLTSGAILEHLVGGWVLPYVQPQRVWFFSHFVGEIADFGLAVDMARVLGSGRAAHPHPISQGVSPPWRWAASEQW